MTTQPGWYADPGSAPGSGQLRWWDGTTWTSHTRSPDVAAAPPQQPQHGQPQHGYQQHRCQQHAYQQHGHPGTGTVTPDGVPLASIWARLAARVLDGLLLAVLTFLATLPVLGDMLDAYNRYLVDSRAAAATGQLGDPFALLGDPAYQRFATWSAVAGLLIGAAYTVLLLRSTGATLGKLALGLRVRRFEQPGQLSWLQCLGRWAVATLPTQVTCGLWFLLDSLWCTWDPRRQTLHDKAARTVVTRR